MGNRHMLTLYFNLIFIYVFRSLTHVQTKHEQINIWSIKSTAWWRHQMETVSALLAICAGIIINRDCNFSINQGGILINYDVLCVRSWTRMRNVSPHDMNRLEKYSHTFSWWRHQMETLSALQDLYALNSPLKGQWRGALMFSLICARTND